jgi:hypothetical protein
VTYFEVVRRVSDSTKVGDYQDGYWDLYQRFLQDDKSFSRPAIEVIVNDTDLIVDEGICGAGELGSLEWESVSRLRTGLVVGAVQSGKTASMLGVIAKAIDQEVDIVVVLSGTRKALWQQTYFRIARHLGFESQSDNSNLLPNLSSIIMDPDLDCAKRYTLTPRDATRKIANGQPLIIVVMKHNQHIREVSEFLNKRVFPQVKKEMPKRKLHLLVIDDEADDGSVLDAVVEKSNDSVHKQIPRSICQIWDPNSFQNGPSGLDLYTTYIGYTATPAAILLQESVNPLYPRQFIAALRTPGKSGKATPRELTFMAGDDPRSWYTGGDVYYKQLDGTTPLIRTISPNEDPESVLVEAIRSYLVAGALRLWQHLKATNQDAPPSGPFATRHEALQKLPEPHSMLVHPSGEMESHFAAAARIISWAHGLNMANASDLVRGSTLGLDGPGIKADLEEHLDLWEEEFSKLLDSSQQLYKVLAVPAASSSPTPSWIELKRLIKEHLLATVKISIVNSSDESDDYPDFDLTKDGEGWASPRNLNTIFVAGNIMSRGLTIEGLNTTLFLRGADDPAADTQMQMQRWFGYRGDHLGSCRIFVYEDQLKRFGEYHDADRALRTQILRSMNEGSWNSDVALVIEGLDWKATGKIAQISKTPLFPGYKPFVTYSNPETEIDPNFSYLERVFAENASTAVQVKQNSTPIGQILEEPLDLLETAQILDGLFYPNGPGILETFSPDKWKGAENLFPDNLPLDIGRIPLLRYHDEHEGGKFGWPTNKNPHDIAAYLRFWSCCLDFKVEGLYQVDRLRKRWNDIEAESLRAIQPHFYVGIKFGDGEELDTTISDRFRASKRGAKSEWGSRGRQGNYAGDEFFDFHHYQRDNSRLDTLLTKPERSREIGDPGLVLFYVSKVPGSGRYPVVNFGVCIPPGGPDLIAATSSNRKKGANPST